MYKLSQEEASKIEDILDAAEEHAGFVNGRDVAAIAKILKNAFGIGADSSDAKPTAKAPKGKTQAKATASCDGGGN